MTDVKREALIQALHYHNSLFGAAPNLNVKSVKRPTAEQIVATAKKFVTFLDKR